MITKNTTGTKEPYDTLGLRKGAGQQEIKQAYFKLVRRYSPELFPEEFTKIRNAYDVLRNPEKRAKVDLLAFDPPEGAVGFSDVEVVERTSLVKLNGRIRELEETQQQGRPPAPDLIRLFKQRSVVYFQLGEEDKAREEWERLVPLVPGDREIGENILRYYMKRGFDLARDSRLKEALEAWLIAHRLVPKNRAVSHNLALAYHALRQDYEALPHWQACLKVWERRHREAPSDAYMKALVKEASRQLGEFRHLRTAAPPTEAPKAETEKVRPRFSDPNKQMGFACFDEGNFREAVASLERYLRQNPDDAEALNLLGRAYLASGNRDKPFVVWNRLRRLDPENPEVKRNIVDAHMQIAAKLMEDDLFTPAMVHLKKVQQVEPTHTDCVVELARIHIARGDFHTAQGELERLLARDPRNRMAKKLLLEVKVRTVGR